MKTEEEEEMTKVEGKEERQGGRKNSGKKRQETYRQNSGSWMLFVNTGRAKCQFLWCISEWWLPLSYPVGISRQYWHTASTPKWSTLSFPQWGCPEPAGKMEYGSMWGIKTGGWRYEETQGYERRKNKEEKKQVLLHSKRQASEPD